MENVMSSIQPTHTNIMGLELTNSGTYRLTPSTPSYKFNEGELIDEFKKYVDNTYKMHYSGKYQATDMIIDAGHGTGFCVGNIMKYAKRYGKKKGEARADLLKIMHYTLLQLHIHDKEQNGNQD